MLIFNNFCTEYSIVSGVTSCEIFAARELKYFINKISSVSFTMTEVYVKENLENHISIGKTVFFEKTVGKNLLSEVKADGYVIFCENNNLYICGKIERGTLNGVYGFLKQFCGVSFLSENDVFIPALNFLEISDNTSIVDNPSFDFRVFFSGTDVRNGLFATRSRLSCPYMYEGDVESFGGNFDIWNTSSIHTMTLIVPPEKYAKIHPEWFSNAEHKYPWICLSNGLTSDGKIDESMNESVVKTVLEYVKRTIIEKPKVKYVLIGQSDNDDWCKCETCRKFYNRFNKHYWWENEGVMALLTLFTNCIAEETEKWLNTYAPERKVMICTLSYRGTLHPPICRDKKNNIIPIESILVPRKNVGIFYCASGGCQTHRIVHGSICDKARHTYDDLEGWHALGANLMVYDYYTNFNNTLWYYPYLHNFKNQLKAYKDFGVNVIYRQVLHIEGKNFDAILQHYLCSEFFWNEDKDLSEVVTDFLNKYFHKDITPYILHYLDIMEGAVYDTEEKINRNIHSAMYFEEGNLLYDKTVWTKEVLFSAISVLEQAIKKVSSLPISESEKNILRNKLLSVLVQPEMMTLANYSSYFQDAKGKESLKIKFADDLKKVGIVYFSESCKSRYVIRTNENIEKYLTTD